jgi:hypothetical protein
MAPQFSRSLNIKDQTRRSVHKEIWSKQVTYQEYYHNFKINHNRIMIMSLYILELESESS